MTSFTRFISRNYDMQDGVERHVWGGIQYTDEGGAYLTVRGTDTQDEEAVIINTGVGMSFDDNTNTEVFLLALQGDMDHKFAIPTIPRNKQRRWQSSTNGIQNAFDGERAVEFNSKRIYADDPNFATRDGVLEVKGDTVYIRGNLVVAGTLEVGGSLLVQGSIIGPEPHGSATVTVPGFDR